MTAAEYSKFQTDLVELCKDVLLMDLESFVERADFSLVDARFIVDFGPQEARLRALRNAATALQLFQARAEDLRAVLLEEVTETKSPSDK